MTTPRQPFDELTEQVRRQTATVPAGKLDAQHARAVASLAPQVDRRGWWLPVAGLTTAALVGVLLFRGLSGSPGAMPDELPYVVEGGQQGVAVTAHERPAVVRFDEQQSVQVELGATAQVVRATRAEVRVRLKTGAVTASVHSGPHRTWVVEADDVRVTALGTIFTVRWEPSRSHLEVTVREGAVRVEGGPFREGGLVVDPQHPLDFVGTGFDAGTLAQVEEATIEADVAEPLPVEVAPKPSRLKPARSSAMEVLRRQLAEGLSAEAVTTFAAMKDTQEVRPEELFVLATHARRLRRNDLAERWFEALRQRDPRGPRASEAAYFLGRLTVDGAGSPAVARRWFEAAFTEAPNGTYAEESLGRCLELARAGKDDAAARRYATTSLERWPAGLYSALARAVLEGR